MIRGNVAPVLKKNQKKDGDRQKFPITVFITCHTCGLFAGLNGCFSEILEILHKSKRGFACTCSCGFISLFDLSLCICSEISVLSFDFLNKFFHNFTRLFVKH